jgi:hypothetical protein
MFEAGLRAELICAVTFGAGCLQYNMLANMSLILMLVRQAFVAKRSIRNQECPSR